MKADVVEIQEARGKVPWPRWRRSLGKKRVKLHRGHRKVYSSVISVDILIDIKGDVTCLVQFAIG